MKNTLKIRKEIYQMHTTVAGDDKSSKIYILYQMHIEDAGDKIRK
jgi:hypothetical protein